MVDLKPKRVCVFCGAVPKNKSKEHVLPRWLLELTGDPGRLVPLGLDWQTGKLRTFAFDQLTFPACEPCNANFGKELEAPMKRLMLEILSGNAFDADAITLLLDWFDKVRIGLWLGFRFLDKNFFGVIPHFHAASRIRRQDRMVAIYRHDDGLSGLGIAGVNSPAFQQTPGCFTLRVNDVSFFNMSGEFLFSARFGLPYIPQITHHAPTASGEMPTSGILVAGSGRVKQPLLRGFKLIPGSIELYQAVVPPV